MGHNVHQSRTYLLTDKEIALNGVARLIHRSSRQQRSTSFLRDLQSSTGCCLQSAFQDSRACLSMPTQSFSSLSPGLLPTCCLFKPPTSSFIVILVVIVVIIIIIIMSLIPRTRLMTVGDRAFPVARSRLYDSIYISLRRVQVSA